MNEVAEYAVVGGVSALGGGVVGYLVGLQGKVTLNFIAVTGHPKGYGPLMLVIEETRRAIWIQDPDTLTMLKYLLNCTKPYVSIGYEDFVARYEVIRPGQLLWNKTAASF